MAIDSQERDDVLLRRSARGDEVAFTALYHRHQGALYRFAYRMTGNAWGAEEIVQDVFMTLVRNSEKFDIQRGPLPAFLYGIARNKIMKHLERTPRDLQFLENAEESGQNYPQAVEHHTPERVVETQERRNLVRAAVLELPFEFREAVVLCLLEERSYEEAARLLECPIGTIRSRLHRGRALLMAKLEFLRYVPKRANAVG